MTQRFHIGRLIAGFAFYLMSPLCPFAAAAASDYLVQVWDTDSGLPHSTVTSIAQTPDGYLWVGTLNGGLARFDGVRFVNFHPGNTPALKSFEIKKLLVDRQGTLWVGLVEGTLASHRDGRFQLEHQDTQTPASWLGEVVASGTNEVVLSSYSGWLFRGTRAGQTNHWKTLLPPQANNLSSPCADRDGAIWYCTADARLGVLRSNVFSRMPNPPGLRSPQINMLLADPAGRLWVGTEKELAVWDGQTFVDMTPTNGMPELAVRQMVAGRDGALWVRTDDQLRKCAGRNWVATARPWSGQLRSAELRSTARYPLRLLADSHGGVWVAHYGDELRHVDSGGQVTRVGKEEGLPSGEVECWFEDREGNVWVGLAGGGLACVQPRKFHTVWPTEGQESKVASSICEDRDGTMWFGTGGESLLRWRGGEFAQFTPTAQPTVGLEIKVVPDGDGRLWVGSVGNGVLAFASDEFKRPFPSEDIGRVARALYTDRRGALWIGNEFGLFRWDQGKLQRFTAAEGFTAAFVLAITEDNAGNLWVATGLGELRRFKAGRFESFRPKDSPVSEAIVKAAATADPFQFQNRGALGGGERFWALHADAEGVIWIGSLGGGLLRFEEGKFTRYKTHEGLPSDHVSQILEDERGQLWLGTRRGIARVSRGALNAIARGENVSLPVVTYGKPDGLPALECSEGSQPACWKSHDGRLWFSTIKGAVWVDPGDLSRNQLLPPVVLEEILLDRRRLVPTRLPSGFTVPPGQHQFEFRFTALSFNAPDKVRFQWRLTGLEKDWVDGGTLRAANYSSIPPGDYQFQVRACNNDGVWNEAGAAVRFTVRPYWWQTPWFPFVGLLAVAAVTATAVALGLRTRQHRRLARLKQQRDAEAERIRIARDLHDELGSGLTEVSMLAAAFPGADLTADKLHERLRRVGDRALKLVNALDEIVWAVDPRKDNLAALAKYFAGQIEHYLADSEIHCRVEVPVVLPMTPVPTEMRHHLYMAVREALNNAVRHAQPRQIGFGLHFALGQLQLTVWDDGCGFDPATAAPGNGLTNLRERLAKVGGVCEIISQPGAGTTIKLVVTLPAESDFHD